MGPIRSAVAVAFALIVTTSGVTAGLGAAAVTASGFAASPPDGAGSNGNGPGGEGPPGRSDRGTGADENEEDGKDEEEEDGADEEADRDDAEADDGEADREAEPSPSESPGAGGPQRGNHPGRGPPIDGMDGSDDASDDESDGDHRGGPPADRGNASVGPPAHAATAGPNASARNGTRRGPPAWAGAAGRANASVSNATAGTPARVNVSDARTADVGVNALTVTTNTNESYALNVTAGDRSPADAPDFDAASEARGGSTATVGHVRVDHTVPDTNISGVDFDFTVNASRLTAVNATPENVALYRYHDGEWAELNTTLVGELTRGNRTVYAFRARSPGLSDFVIGAKRSEFELADALVSADRVTVGESVMTRVRVRNTGGADGTLTVTLLLNDRAVDERTVTVASDGIRQVSFERPFDEAGEYAVRVNDVDAGRVVVVAPVDAGGTASVTGVPAGTPETGTGTKARSSESTGRVTATGTPEFGPTVAVLAVTLLLPLVVRRRRA